MPTDLEQDTTAAVALCRGAHQRLIARVEPLGDEQVRAPSRLPGWSVGHVLTHLARNAEGMSRRLEAALRGEDLPRYPGGPAQRDGDIASGAARSAGELAADVAGTARRLEEVWAESAAAGWPHAELLADDTWPTTASPSRRLREVEVHHVDLRLGYEPADWPEGYVEWDLPVVLASLPARIPDPGSRRDLLAWLTGRRPDLAPMRLEPW
ncbi:MAG TPA: maleylpyruvate isomerase N-terminal domain-containing protein [Acidimicrobiales bacterium]|nr:maleylpyruvate isomerase N-terminal domain-containing protein [Acidimicrobiales bacterium]